MSGRTRTLIVGGLVTMLTGMCLILWLIPFFYMLTSSFKSLDQMQNGRILPSTEAMFEYEGEEFPLYNVPMDDGSMAELALVKKGREESEFVDPNNVEAGPVVWEGRWRTLEPTWEFAPTWENYPEAWTTIEFPTLLFNTFAIAVLGIIGTVISCTMVAYGFARFPIPGKNILFLILISTIVLPRQVTLVPTYTIFARWGWVGTWLPLIVPHMFANAYNVFLLRQYFLSIPTALDEAAMIDGADPIQILLRIIVPQSWPVIIAVSIFHLVFAWNDYFEPLIYLRSERHLWPISVGLQDFMFIYGAKPQLLQAGALIGLSVPVLLFFLAQGYFMQGVKFTGVDK